MDTIGNTLKQYGFTKKSFAMRLNLSPVTVYAWSELPGYAYAYLQLIERYDELKKSVKDFAEEI